MRTLMLLRHAKAVPADGKVRDRDRPLASRGKKDAPKIGAYMSRHGLAPDCVLVSPSKRTQETWELVAPALGKQLHPTFEERLYDASARTIMDVIRDVHADCHTAMVIGHNPGMQRVA